MMGDGLVSKDQRRKILTWLTNGKGREEKNDALFRLWENTDVSEISHRETLESLAKVKSRLGIDEAKPKTSHSLFFQSMKYAAVILPIVMVMSIWMYMGKSDSSNMDMVECFVPNGEQKEISLPDGTKVILNSGSFFLYPEKFNNKYRKVYLSGEAYFDVAHKENQPFTVHTGRLNIEVLGTKFNVEAYSDDSQITTTLKQGKVKLSVEANPESGSIVMKPDEQVVYNVKSGEMKLSTVNAEDYSSWTDGSLRFVECPLSEVMKVVGRKYDVSFRYDEKINLDELYTIVFTDEDTIEQVMNLMKSLIGNGMEYSIKDNSVYLYVEEKGGSMK